MHNIRSHLLLGLCYLLLAFSAQARGSNILVLGDSISAAYGMSLEQGWVALLQRQLDTEKLDYRVINASISGETTGGALRRLPDLLERHVPHLVIIELGGNDGLRGYPINRLRDNLENLVSLSSQAGADVLLLPMRIPPNYGTRYTGAFYDSYLQIAEKTPARLAPFILEGIAVDFQLMQADGIHPRTEVQAMMLENVMPAIREALEQL